MAELDKAVALDLTAVQPLWDLSGAYVALHNLPAARAALVDGHRRASLAAPRRSSSSASSTCSIHAPQAAFAELRTAIASAPPPPRPTR